MYAIRSYYVASSKADNYSYVPTEYEIDQEAAYLHITSNNTIFGTSYPSLPKTGKVELVADMSSEICGVERDMSKFGLVYAGAQKNIGPAGLTVVIVKKSLLNSPLGITPQMLNYSELASTGSMLNTPCTYAIYIAMLNFEYMLERGGVKGAQQRNKEKAALVYDALDSSSFYVITSYSIHYTKLYELPFIAIGIYLVFIMPNKKGKKSGSIHYYITNLRIIIMTDTRSLAIKELSYENLGNVIVITSYSIHYTKLYEQSAFI